MSRKVFISVLGTGFYEKSHYVKDDFVSSHTRYIQQATLEWLGVKEEWGKEDVALFLLTDKAKTENWSREQAVRKNRDQQEVSYESLKDVIEQMQLPCKLQTEIIPNGLSEAEIWKIFETIHRFLKEGDELYFDLTHGFRYLPMLVLVLGSYARFLNKTVVKSVSYGNFEARVSQGITSSGEEILYSPIVDLLPLMELQEWAYAAGQYLDSGNVDALVELSSRFWEPRKRASQGKDKEALKVKGFVENLAKVVKQMQTCRGESLRKGEEIGKLKKALQIEYTAIPALNPLFEKIQQSFAPFCPSENVYNGFVAARWCLENGLYQQSTTLLEEAITTFFCEKHHFNLTNKDERTFVGRVLNKAGRGFKWDEKDELFKERSKPLFEDEQIQRLRDKVEDLKKLRNDFNHAGMKREPMSADTLKRKTKEFIDFFMKELFPQTPCA